MAGLLDRLITRRRAIRAGAGAAVTVAAVSALAGCNNGGDEVSEPVVVDERSATNVTDIYTEVDDTLEETNRWELPIGTVLRPLSGASTWVPAISAGTSAMPIVCASAFSIATGELKEVVSTLTMGDSPNIILYDVRCSESVYAWIEMDALDRSWALYAASFSNGALSGSPATLWTGDADLDPPYFAVAGSRVIWQVMPSVTGDKTTESSYCYLWHAGDKKAKAVVESPGRFATPPALSEATVTLTPRVRSEEGRFYGITCYRLDDDMGSTVDQLVLPQTVQPFRAVRMGDRFAFSIEANYSSGGLLGQMGTYFGSGDGPFVTLVREPAAAVAGKSSRALVKSRSSYFVLDTAKETFSILGAVNRATDYGEYPACEGVTDTFVTFATVKDATTSTPTSVIVRAFKL